MSFVTEVVLQITFENEIVVRGNQLQLIDRLIENTVENMVSSMFLS